jgi:formamidopyrimidine-DNA glycosylase
MPELPEVETMRRGIAAATGAAIARIARPPSRLRAIEISPSLPVFRRRAVGRTIERVDRLGKRIVLVLDSCDRIVIEPRMTGLVLLADPPDCEHLRLVIELEDVPPQNNPKRQRGLKPNHAPSLALRVGMALQQDKRQILFWDQRGLGVVRLVSPDEFDRLYGTELIGPDALAVTVDELGARLRKSRRAIKVALLDQKALAGVGNLYASEILHRAGVHPAKACCRLRSEQWQRIHAEMRCLLLEAIEHQGSTLRDGTYRIARDAPGNFQFRHRVYQRHGQLCFTCGRSLIVRIVQAQRSTFFCPTCQRK